MSTPRSTHARPDPRRGTGQRAEEICARRLRARGWQILARNWRIKAGEIDLIARSGPILVIVEVKAGHRGSLNGPQLPVLAVGPNKQRRLRRLASGWIASHGRTIAFREVRFDVVGVLFERDGSLAAYDHLENAF
ncbi:MAG TPA: YraN family protein [Solirubrobacterales bacterium]|nr:YraN family protein [Solirubrobacterales bacterium]